MRAGFAPRSRGCGEFIHIVIGRMTCIEDGGSTTELSVGDSMTFPHGRNGEWQDHTPLRKFYCELTPEHAAV